MPSFRNLIQRRKKAARSRVDGQVASTATASEALLENVAEASITAPVPSAQAPEMISSDGAENETITEHLWSRAYQALRERERELMDAYESYLGICAGDECAVFSNPEAGAELIRKLQEGRDEKQWRFSFGGKDHKMRDQVEKLVKLLVFSDAVIKQAVSARPHAALAWSGVSIFLPLLSGAFTKNEDMVKGLASIGDIQLYWKTCEDTFFTSSSAFQDLIPPLSKVYSQILEYQIRAVHHLSKTQSARAWQKVAGWSDWRQNTIAIEKASEACKTHIPPLQQREARENFSTEMSKLDKLFQTERDILQLMRESRLKDKEGTVLQELFSAGSSYASDKDFNPTQVQGTCEWLFSDQTFCSWRDNLESDIFWISAGPGCGKSVLSRALVDHGHLQSNSSTISFSGTATVENRTATTCYFFFKDDSSRRNNLSRALCAILHQLFSNQATKALISHAVSAYQTKGKALMEDPHSLWNVLARCADEWSGGAIICLLDALDECQSNGRFSLLTMLKDYYSQDGRTGKLKFLITSRPYDDIEQSFRNLARRARFLHFDGDEKHEEISSDINRVIDGRMDDFAADFEPSDRRKIAEHLKRRGTRTYLWLHLTLDIIKQSPSEYSRRRDIEALLASLPLQVSEAYEKILNRSKNHQITVTLLSILLAATRPLTITEANYALTMALAETPFRAHIDAADQRWKGNFKSVVKNFCGLIVNVYDNRLSFIHLTAREFLLSDPSPILQWKGRFADRSVLHKDICDCCVSYLLLDDWAHEAKEPTAPSILRLLREFPLFSYAAVSWFMHLEYLDHTSYNSLKPKARLLATTKGPYLKLWAKSNIIRKSYREHDYFEKWTDLAVVSFLGLRGIVEDMLEEDGIDVNAWSAYWGSALQVAVSSNSVPIAKILLHRGADVNSTSGVKGTALTIAARNRNAALVELLLSYGANARTSSQDIFDNALFAAAYTKNGEIFRAILATLVNLDTVEGVEAAVIDESVMGRHAYCMSMLISVLGPEMPLTQRMAEVLMDEVQVANKVLRMIISRTNRSIILTPHMFGQALKGVNGADSLRTILITADAYKMGLTEEALACAARFSDVETMDLLLKQCTGLGAVTSKVLKGAIMNEPGRCADMLRFLLNKNKDIVVIDEDVVWLAASSNDVGLVKLVVGHPGFMAGVAHDFISTAIEATKRASNAEIVKYLLEQSGDEVITSDAIVADAARYGTPEMMKLFLDQVDDGFVPSENILCGAAENVRCAMPMLHLIVRRFSEHVVFTENLLRAARHGFDVSNWLLKGYGDQFLITAELLCDVVVCHEWNLMLFMEYKHQELQQHAPTVLLALAQCSERCNLRSLLESYITTSMVTEEVLLGILRKRRRKMLMTEILEQFGPDLVISEGVLKRVVMVPADAPYLLNMIKARCPRCFTVTEGVLEAAATEGREDVLVFLSEFGGSGVVIENKWWLAAQFRAAANVGDRKGMQHAIDKGADVNTQNIDGESALNRVTRIKNDWAVEFLAAQPGINVNMQDEKGLTPLHCAVMSGAQQSIRLLVAAGADPDQANNDGLTPYMLACENPRMAERTIRILRDARKQ